MLFLARNSLLKDRQIQRRADVKVELPNFSHRIGNDLCRTRFESNHKRQSRFFISGVLKNCVDVDLVLRENSRERSDNPGPIGNPESNVVSCFEVVAHRNISKGISDLAGSTILPSYPEKVRNDGNGGGVSAGTTSGKACITAEFARRYDDVLTSANLREGRSPQHQCRLNAGKKLARFDLCA